MPKFDLKSFLSTIQKFKVTYLIFAPPVVSMLVKSPLVSQYDLSSVKFLVCGAAPLQADVEKRLEALFSKTGARSRQGWGMSEATMSISIFGPDEFDPSHGSVGYLVANMQLQIIDENGKALGYDEEGEAILRGPNIFKGYYKNPVATKESFTDNGWLKTGDIIKIDKTGLVTIVDRKKVCICRNSFKARTDGEYQELIKVKGFQVAPSELEGHLLEHEGVLDCAVIRVLRYEYITSLPWHFTNSPTTVTDTNMPKHTSSGRSQIRHQSLSCHSWTSAYRPSNESQAVSYSPMPFQNLLLARFFGD